LLPVFLFVLGACGPVARLVCRTRSS
jgi:hypothetical protein